MEWEILLQYGMGDITVVWDGRYYCSMEREILLQYGMADITALWSGRYYCSMEWEILLQNGMGNLTAVFRFPLINIKIKRNSVFCDVSLPINEFISVIYSAIRRFFLCLE